MHAAISQYKNETAILSYSCLSSISQNHGDKQDTQLINNTRRSAIIDCNDLFANQRRINLPEKFY